MYEDPARSFSALSNYRNAAPGVKLTLVFTLWEIFSDVYIISASVIFMPLVHFFCFAYFHAGIAFLAISSSVIFSLLDHNAYFTNWPLSLMWEALLPRGVRIVIFDSFPD